MFKKIELTGRIVATIGLLGLLVLSLAILLDAVSRTLLNTPIYGLSDLVEILAPVIVASCFPTTIANRQNITIRYLGRALPARGGQAIELFGQIAVIIVFIGIVYQTGRYTLGLIEHGQHTWLLGIPIYPSWVLATTLIAISIPILLQQAMETVDNIKINKSLVTSEAELLDEIKRES